MDASFFQVLQLFGMFTEKLASSVQTTGECDNMLPTKNLFVTKCHKEVFGAAPTLT